MRELLICFLYVNKKKLQHFIVLSTQVSLPCACSGSYLQHIQPRFQAVVSCLSKQIREVSIVFKMDSVLTVNRKPNVISCAVVCFFWPIKFPVHVLILFVEKNILWPQTLSCVKLLSEPFLMTETIFLAS